jgi:hypothetical protein
VNENIIKSLFNKFKFIDNNQTDYNKFEIANSNGIILPSIPFFQSLYYLFRILNYQLNYFNSWLGNTKIVFKNEVNETNTIDLGNLDLRNCVTEPSNVSYFNIQFYIHQIYVFKVTNWEKLTNWENKISL